MMSDFVRDDVALREIARRAEAFVEHAVESEVDVDATIFRAIKRTARAARVSAARSGLIREEDELRLFVSAAHFLEELIPDVLGIGQNDGNELRGFIAWGVAFDLPRWSQLRLLLGIDQGRRIPAEKQVSDDENDASDSSADCNASAARAPHILNVFAFSSSLPEHRPERWRDSLLFTN